MALHWEWKNKLGEIELEQNGNKFTLSVYQGNALMIILYEYTDTEGKEVYQMNNFFIDKAHFDNCRKDKTWNYAEGWKKITLWKVPSDMWQVLKDLHKRGVEIAIKGAQ